VKKYKQLSSSLCSFSHNFCLSVLRPNILSNPFSDRLNLSSSRNVRDEVPLSYKTAGKIIVFVYFKLYMIATGKQKILNCVAASVFLCECIWDLLIPLNFVTFSRDMLICFYNDCRESYETHKWALSDTEEDKCKRCTYLPLTCGDLRWMMWQSWLKRYEWTLSFVCVGSDEL
jgi:hypothetical protein